MISVEVADGLSLRRKETATLQTTSDPGVRLDHTIYSMGKLYFCLTYIPGRGTSTTPPSSLQLDIHIYRSGSTVFLRKNPEPLLQRFPGNGFVVISPKTLHLKAGKEATILVNNAFRCKEDVSHICIFFPITNPNLDGQMKMWVEGDNLEVKLRATGDITIEKGSVLGRLHFFVNDPSVLALVPSTQSVWQWSARAFYGRNDIPADRRTNTVNDNNDHNAAESSDTDPDDIADLDDLDDFEEEDDENAENDDSPPEEDFSNLSLNALEGSHSSRSPLREVPPQRTQAEEERFQRAQRNQNVDSDHEAPPSDDEGDDDFLLLVERTQQVDIHAMLNIGEGVLPVCMISFEKMQFVLHNRGLLRRAVFPNTGVNCCETAPIPMHGRYISPAPTQTITPNNDYPPFSSDKIYM